jgi:pyridoxal phosphate enzyme (YggS family)
MVDIAANVRAIRARMAAAAARAGRDVADIVLVAAAKQKDAGVVEAALAAGVSDIGENYVQEAAAKRAVVRSPARWHMIGHLQRNKIAKALEVFDVIHSVDSLALGTAIARRAAAQGTRARVLVEVNVAGESTKSGAEPGAVAQLVAELRKLDGLQVEGLMAVPPVGSPQATRSHFRQMRRLRDQLDLRELSMGMTDDFEIAIEEGATIIRVGRAIFGARTEFTTKSP